MLPVQFDEAKHELHELEVLRYLRRETERKDLLLYRHKATGNWGVGVWLPAKAGGRWFMDLVVSTQPTFSADDVFMVKQWAKGKVYTVQDAARDAEAGERAAAKRQMEGHEEVRRVKRWLGNQQNHVRRTHPDWDIPGWKYKMRPA